MLQSPGWRVFLGFTLTVFFGCGGIEEVSDEGAVPATLAQGVMDEVVDERPPPNGANGTSPSCFWAQGTQQALRTMGGSALDQGQGQLLSIPLTQVSSKCREVLRSAVECALTREQSVQDPVTGERYTGWWGLAPAWQSGALDVDGRRYVTGCMVQRLNYYGTHVPILLEGRHSAIARNATFGPEYPIEESTAFGDLFSSNAPLGLLPAFNLFVCWEDLLPQSCGFLGLPLLEKRLCDDVPLCGLTVLGPCALSCAQDDGYWKCRPGLLSSEWTQTVRVKLETATCQ
jgi:hypothetical protein